MTDHTPAEPLTAMLEVGRDQVLAHRWRVGDLAARLPRSDAALHRAAWVGLTDSTPRAAVTSLHARVAQTSPGDWAHPTFVQLWGPRFSTYVVPARDLGVFSLGRWPDGAARQRLAADLADRLEVLLDGGEMPYAEAGPALGVHPSYLRYAAPTGRVLIRWDGARRPTVRMAPAPQIAPAQARGELVRRFLHVLGPGSAESVASWAGIPGAAARRALAELRAELTAVRTPVGEGWILASDEASFRAGAEGGALAASASAADSVRLLPSGDAYTLLHGRDRELLVPDAARRSALWTSRAWPGAVVVEGEVAGTWRRAGDEVTVSLWDPQAADVVAAVEHEAALLPVPASGSGLRVRWTDVS